MPNQMFVNYRLTFNSEPGKEVLKDLESFCCYDHPCFVRGEADATAFNLGMRNVYLRINKLLNADINQKKQMEVTEDE